MNPSSFVMLATAALFATDAPIATGSPRERRYRPGSTPPKPPEPTPEPAPLPPPDPEAQARALAIPPVTTRAQRRERAWLARVRESERDPSPASGKVGP